MPIFSDVKSCDNHGRGFSARDRPPNHYLITKLWSFSARHGCFTIPIIVAWLQIAA